MYKYYNVLYIDNYNEDNNMKSMLFNIIKRTLIDANISAIIKKEDAENINYDSYDFESYDLVILTIENEGYSKAISEKKVPILYMINNRENPITLAGKVFYSKKKLKESVNDNEYILLNFSSLKDKVKDETLLWINEQIEIAVQILLNKGNKIKVVSLDKRYTNTCRELVYTFQNSNIIYEENTNEVLSLIDNSKFCISLDVNMAFLCIAMEKPFITIESENVVSKVIDINELLMPADDVNVGKILNKIEYIKDNYKCIKETLEKYIESYNEKNIKNFKDTFENIEPKEKSEKGQKNNSLKKLHLGCGKNILDGWINFDDCDNIPLPFEDNSIDIFYANHLIEHINNPLPLMQELYRIAKPGAKAMFKCSYGSSDEAFEDPTYVRQYFKNSFLHFSQPFYWKDDYGYRGDWTIVKTTLKISEEKYKNLSRDEILKYVDTFRNVVEEMMVELGAVKPMREAKKELVDINVIEFAF